MVERNLKFGRYRRIHFVGIGGTGMSGIAEVLNNLRFQVSGSDLNRSDYTKRLEKLGIPIQYEHRAENVSEADAVVVSTAIKPDNPEWKSAEERNLPVIPRGEMLAELMRMKTGIAISGTHGKTTTTSIGAAVLSRAGLDPTVIIGGIFSAYGSNARLGGSDFLLAEADESDGSFLRLAPIYTLITNIDEDHMDHYGTLDNLKDSFVTFADKVPFFGASVVCLEDKNIRSIIPRIRRRVVTYGLSSHCDYRADEIELQPGAYHFRIWEYEADLGRFSLHVPGRHNILNALGIVTLARELELPVDAIREGLKDYRGTKRRAEIVAEFRDCPVVSDYAHHPVEIETTLSALREFHRPKRIICVFQPHRYSRTAHQFDQFRNCFHHSDMLCLLPIYPAGELPIEGISSEALIEAVSETGHRAVYGASGEQQVRKFLADHVESGDLIACFGAGTIDGMARNLGEVD